MPLVVLDDAGLRVQGQVWLERRARPPFDATLELGAPGLAQAMWLLPALRGLVADARIGSVRVSASVEVRELFWDLPRQPLGARARSLTFDLRGRGLRARASGSGGRLTIRVPPRIFPEREQHAWAHWIDGLRSVGFDAPFERPRLRLPRCARARARRFLRAHCGWFGGLLVALAPSGPTPRWPMARFRELARLLRRSLGARFVGFDGAGLADIDARALSALEKACVLSMCGACVGDDSDWVHVAAAVGAPVISLHGQAPAWERGPASAVASAVLGSRCTCTPPERGCVGCISARSIAALTERASAQRWPWDRLAQLGVAREF